MEEKVIQTLSRQRDSGTIVELVENEAGFRFVVKRVQNLEAPIYRAIFQKETQALTRLKACENIVRIFRSDIQAAPDGRSEGIISMEYVQGRPLSQMLDVIPNASTRYNLVKQLTNAIQHAHRNSVIHRDINPSNILITDSFELKLIDFGIAKIRGMFQDGTTYQFATQNYSAPEVTVHSENATERSDIYSLGAVIYFLFTGEVPVTATEMPTASRMTVFDIVLHPLPPIALLHEREAAAIGFLAERVSNILLVGQQISDACLLPFLGAILRRNAFCRQLLRDPFGAVSFEICIKGPAYRSRFFRQDLKVFLVFNPVSVGSAAGDEFSAFHAVLIAQTLVCRDG